MNTVMVSFNTTVRQMTKMFQWPKCLSKKKTGCKYLHLLGMPFAKLALRCIYVYLVMHSIMSVHYAHKATYLLITLNLYRGLCPFINWVSKNVKILNRSMSTKG